MSYKVKSTSLQLLNGAKALADIGRHEEAYSALSSLYADVKGKIEEKHIAPPVQEVVWHIHITDEHMDTLMTYYRKIAEAESKRAQRHYLNLFGKTISNITGDPAFAQELKPLRGKRRGKWHGTRTADVSPTLDALDVAKMMKHKRLSAEVVTPVYSTGEAAEIIGVSSETIRRMCEKGKFPEAEKTDGGHWRIPKKYFKVSLEEAREADQFMKPIHAKTKEQLGDVDVDEIDLDLDRT